LGISLVCSKREIGAREQKSMNPTTFFLRRWFAKKEARETILLCYCHHALHAKFLISSNTNVLKGLS